MKMTEEKLNFDWEDRKPMIQLTNHYGCGFFSKPLAGHPSSILKKNSFIQKTYETMGFWLSGRQSGILTFEIGEKT